MAVFVLCVNLLVAAFTLTFAAEILLLLVGSFLFAYRAMHSKRDINYK
jgi:hypothetical protein